jgi:hypothetical protein
VNREQLQAALELLVDAEGLAPVLWALCRMAADKAEHLRGNWQDGPAARTWEKDGKLIERAAVKVTN